MRNISKEYLKFIHHHFSLLKNSRLLTIPSQNDKVKKFINDTRIRLDNSFELLYISKEGDRTFEFAIFNYVSILEAYCNLFTYSDVTNSDAFAYNKDRTITYKIFSKLGPVINSNFKFEKDFYPFLKNKIEEKDKQYVDYIYVECEYEEKEIKLSFGLKLSALLHYQLNNSTKSNILNEIIFLRNNRIVHTGANFVPSLRTISRDDLLVLFETIKSFLNHSF